MSTNEKGVARRANVNDNVHNRTEHCGQHSVVLARAGVLCFYVQLAVAQCSLVSQCYCVCVCLSVRLCVPVYLSVCVCLSVCPSVCACLSVLCNVVVLTGRLGMCTVMPG